jgi:hypothetical protein
LVADVALDLHVLYPHVTSTYPLDVQSIVQIPSKHTADGTGTGIEAT